MKKYKLSKNGGKNELTATKKKINLPLLASFAIYTVLCFMVYFLSVKAYFAQITLIYIAVLGIGAVIYLPLQTVNLLCQRRAAGGTDTQNNIQKSKRVQKYIKILLFFITPVIFVIIADYLIIALGMTEYIYK